MAGEEIIEVQIATLQKTVEHTTGRNMDEHAELKEKIKDLWDAITAMRDGLIAEIAKRPREQDMALIKRQATVIGAGAGVIGGGLLIGIIMRIAFG